MNYYLRNTIASIRRVRARINRFLSNYVAERVPTKVLRKFPMIFREWIYEWANRDHWLTDSHGRKLKNLFKFDGSGKRLFLGCINGDPNPKWRWWTFWEQEYIARPQEDYYEIWTKKEATPIVYKFNKDLLDKLVRLEDAEISYKKKIND